MTRTLRTYAVSVSVLGLVPAAAVLLTRPFDGFSAAAIALALAMAVAELSPVVIVRRDGNEDIELSHAFLLAILLVAGVVPAVAAAVASSVVTNLIRRRPAIKTWFNIGQKSASASLACLAFTAVADAPAMAGGLDEREIAAFLLAALVFQLCNDTAVAVACALAEGQPVLGFLRADLRPFVFNAAVSLTAPLVAAVVLFEWWLVPLSMAPLWAMRSTAQMHLEVVEQSRRDALTGLHNATALRDALDAGPATVVMFDLDNFKDVNDTLGHQSGDLLLRAVAKRLTHFTHGHGRLFRMQGDEFVALLDDAGSQEALAYAEALVCAFQEPFQAGDLELEVGLSAGVAPADPEADTDEVLRRADHAMYEAKRHRTGVALHAPDLDPGDRSRQIVSADLRRALAAGELEVHYQPQVSLVTGRVESVEALVRWRRDGKIVLPGEFIPQAEHTAVILPLTLHVLRTAIADCRWWTDEYGYRGRVGINVSARTLHHPGLLPAVREALEQSGMDAERLEIEITESALIADPAGARRTLAALRALGASVLIDDFGTGYSSLAYLGTLPVDGLKIDRGFVSGMAAEHTDLVIVRSTLDLGHNLGLRVVAEGVEDTVTRDGLAALGCDLAQGWLWSRAVCAEELGAMLVVPAAARLAA